MSMVKDIHCIKQKFQKLGFTWTPREGNRVAHQIALFASQQGLPANWTRNQPVSLSTLIQNDKLQISHTRGESKDDVNNQDQGDLGGGSSPSVLLADVHSKSGVPFDSG